MVVVVTVGVEKGKLTVVIRLVVEELDCNFRL